MEGVGLTEQRIIGNITAIRLRKSLYMISNHYSGASLSGAGVLFGLFGVMIFDNGLLALGNFLFLAGVCVEHQAA